MSTTLVAASGGFKLFIKYVKVSSIFLLLFIVLINSIVKSIEKKSPLPFFEDVGNKLVLSTKNLVDQSNIIIAAKSIYDFSSFKNTINTITLISDFILAGFMSYTWITVLGKLWNATPFSFKGNTFALFFFGGLTFYIVQVIFMLAAAWYVGEIASKGAIAHIFLIPFQAIILAIKATSLILIPVSKKVDTILQIPVNSTNTTL